MATPDEMLAEAKAIHASDPDRALELRRTVASASIGPAWVEANADLASHELGTANYAAAADYAAKVLGTPADLGPRSARAAAAIILCNAREALDLDVDPQLLEDSANDAISTGQPYYAAIAFNQLARRNLAAGDRDGARRFMLRAVDLYDESGSMTGGPGTLARLAEIELAESRGDEAAAHVERALSRLAAFPLGGSSVRMLERKLRALQQKFRK